MAGKLLLRGIYGTVKGKEYFINLGESVTLGRSRSCDISLGQTEESETDGDHESRHFQTVSRKHLRICYYKEDEVELNDLSSNGSYLDGEPIEHAILKDFKTEIHLLVLGTREKFTLEWVSS